MNIDFNKNTDGLVPAIVQDAVTKNVLMLGFMNQEAFQKTKASGLVTFFSRTKNRLWTKGEESGNVLDLVDMKLDCDNDTLLVSVIPKGPTCHKGSETCWNEDNNQSFGFISKLEDTISSRIENADTQKSYVASLFAKGINKVAQKVGEEAVEVVIEAKDNNDDLFLEESADLLFHYLMLLQAKGYKLNSVVDVLKGREK
ncbi:bifunctional phosphoribosyl-AMP cyclohydrolase/phosphoribosyl-ATP diphosphatase HisIE [uncultured Winogradskyella sp.]|jgi:phosphoribosyl-ATP pyrophosphohydrolase/phosphoribosyl-AMP cyclohydrolase|uniref:bifunctional phosphoribosyl-AMP cyclohydrolase/phosphoribosyl-ATP diphosphatase HisIE n=1 Tax=uncultured Winogradskyella sp. TaxID=395353 RepID=UPI0025CC2AC2|nr:bifunctional phosphoribosyl-AMP cyclohydrolase/phosphoribosyl-ATP diphosphatase HisIE [uncultured Winogradskyella sp.]